jgi:predicted nucleotidyltransferase
VSSPDLTIVREFKRRAEDAPPGRIAHVALFGSHARGDARADSDWDIAVFVHDKPTPNDWRKLGAISFDMTAEIGFMVQFILLPLARMNDGSAHTTGVAEDGIAA